MRLFERPTTDNRIVKKTEHYLQRLAELNSQNQWLENLQQQFPGEELVVLSIGCGDEPIEADAFDRIFTTVDVAYRFLGVDVSGSDIAKCQAAYSGQPNINFATCSCTDHASIKNLLYASQVHIIVLRHPLINEEFETSRGVAIQFREAFLSSIPALLAHGGTLLVSNFYEEEQLRLIELFSLISDRQPAILSPSQQIFERSEYATSLIGREKKVRIFVDHYFTAYTDFIPTLASQAQTSAPDLERSETQQLVDNLISKIVSTKVSLPMRARDAEGEYSAGGDGFLAQRGPEIFPSPPSSHLGNRAEQAARLRSAGNQEDGRGHLDGAVGRVDFLPRPGENQSRARRTLEQLCGYIIDIANQAAGANQKPILSIDTKKALVNSMWHIIKYTQSGNHNGLRAILTRVCQSILSTADYAARQPGTTPEKIVAACLDGVLITLNRPLPSQLPPTGTQAEAGQPATMVFLNAGSATFGF